MISSTLTFCLMLTLPHLVAGNAVASENEAGEQSVEQLANGWLQFLEGTWTLSGRAKSDWLEPPDDLQTRDERIRVTGSPNYNFHPAGDRLKPKMWCAWDAESRHIVIERWVSNEPRTGLIVMYILRFNSISRDNLEGQLTRLVRARQFWRRIGEFFPSGGALSQGGKHMGNVVLRRIDEDSFMIRSKPVHEPDGEYDFEYAYTRTKRDQSPQTRP